jgi:Domain of unknown function (DUF4129)
VTTIGGIPRLSLLASPIPSVAAYRRSVHSLRVALDGFGNRIPNDGTVAAIQSRIRGLEAVRYPDGRTISTGMRVVANLLAGSPAPSSFRLVQGRLDALDGTLRSPRVRAPSGPQIQSLHRILAGSDFHQGTPLTLGTILARLLARLFRDLPRSLGDHLTANPAPFTIVGVLIVVATLVLAGSLARRATLRAASSAAIALASERKMSSSEARRRASELATAGQYRDALRYLFAGVLLELQEAGTVQVRAGLTNRELLHQLEDGFAGATVPGPAPASAGLAALSDLIAIFDDVWYGHAALDDEGYRRCEELARSASRLAIHASHGPAGRHARAHTTTAAIVSI